LTQIFSIAEGAYFRVTTRLACCGTESSLTSIRDKTAVVG